MDATRSARFGALATLWAILVSPREAFVAIRERPVWGWALAITIVLSALGSALMVPAARHVQEVAFLQHGKEPQAVAIALELVDFAWLVSIISVPIFVVAEAAILFGIRAAASGTATFRQILALVAHVQFIALGIGSLVAGIIVALRPPSSYHTQADLVTAMPSSAWLAPAAPEKLSAFLTAIGPFQIWSTIVLGLGLIAVARFRPAAAWTAAIVLLLAAAAWGAVFVR